MKRMLIASLGFMPILISCGAASVDTTKVNKAEPDSTKTALEIKAQSAWEYNNEEDKITNKMMYGAMIEANTPLDLKFPYEGARAYLRLVYTTKNMLVLAVTKGQFMASAISNEAIKIKFDNNKPETYNCPSSSDGDSRFLLIGNSNKLIDKLKHSNKVIIEAEMFENGYQQMEFETKGLVWNH